MPAAKQSGRTTRAASRGRSSSNGSSSKAQSGSSGSSRSRTSARQKPRSTQKNGSSRTTQKHGSSRTTQKNGSSRTTQKNGSSSPQASSNGSSSQASNGTLKGIGISALSATVGVAGGVLLGRSALQRNRKLLGVSVPSKIDLTGVGQQIGEAGRQFGKLAKEISAVREKAEQVGKLLT